MKFNPCVHNCNDLYRKAFLLNVPHLPQISFAWMMFCIGKLRCVHLNSHACVLSCKPINGVSLRRRVAALWMMGVGRVWTVAFGRCDVVPVGAPAACVQCECVGIRPDYSAPDHNRVSVRCSKSSPRR